MVDEPWIPCLKREGAGPTRVEASLREALLHANEFACVLDRSPLTTASIHRLLLAVLQASVGEPSDGDEYGRGPASNEGLENLWRSGGITASPYRDRVEAYLNRWRDRFWLYHPERPFYQTTDLDDFKDPVTRLAHDAASGNNATLWDHSFDDDPPALEPAQVARLLLAFQTFALGGGKSEPFYLKDVPIVKSAACLLVGGNLAETLALNLVPYTTSKPFNHARPAEDAPFWERDALPEATAALKDYVPAGYLDYLTVPPRRVRLKREADGTCRWVAVAAYHDVTLGTGYHDPMVAYRIRNVGKGKNEELPVAFRAERALWRESRALFFSTTRTDEAGRTGARPFTFDVYYDLFERDVEMPTPLLEAFGLAKEKAKMLLWRHERLPFSARLLDEEVVELLDQEVQVAEEVAKLLQPKIDQRWTSPAAYAAKLVLHYEEKDRQVEAAGRGLLRQQRDEVVGLVKSLAPERAYWGAVDLPFRRFMARMAAGDDEDDATDDWRGEVRRAATNAWDGMFQGLGRTVEVLRARSLSNRYFLGMLRRRCPTRRNDTGGGGNDN